MKFFTLLFFVALIFPALAFGQVVTIQADTGATVTLALDALAQTTHTKIKVDHGVNFLAVLAQLSLVEHRKQDLREDRTNFQNRLKALSLTDEAKIRALLAQCELGPC